MSDAPAKVRRMAPPVKPIPKGPKVPIEPDNPRAEGLDPRISSETFTKEVLEDLQTTNLNSSSSYTLARESLLSRNVDRWMNGENNPSMSMESTGVQNSRTRLIQRSTLAMAPSFRSSGLWYVLALVLPLFSISPGYNPWRCNPSSVLSTAELFLAHISSLCERIRNHIRRLACDQLARDVFAAAMDFVLVAYAVGFLILSMYQANIIG